MNSKLLGACAVIILALAVDRMIPTRTDTLADIYVPVLTGAFGILACIGTWKERKWGVALALVFSLVQLFSIVYISSVTSFPTMRILDLILLLIVLLSSILSLTKCDAVQNTMRE